MKPLLTVLLSLLPLLPLQATEPNDDPTHALHGSLGFRSTGAGYSSDAPRNRFTSSGLFLDLDAPRWLGLTLGGDRDQVTLTGQPTSPQTNTYGNLRLYLPLGDDGGKLILRADGHRISYPIQGSSDTTQATMVGGHLGYLSAVDPTRASLFLDVAFHRSTYPNAFLVDQWTPTLGFGVNGNADWLSLSAATIRSHTILPSGQDVSLETCRSWRARWTHYFLPGFALKPATFGLSGQGGKRLYGVDPDAGLMVNVGDPQTATALASISWKVRACSLGFDGGRSIWQPTATPRYTSHFLTTTLTISW